MCSANFARVAMVTIKNARAGITIVQLFFERCFSLIQNLVFDKFQQNHTLTCDVIMTSLEDRNTLLEYIN